MFSVLGFRVDWGKDAKMAKLFLRGVAAAAARSGEFRTGEQVSARNVRGRFATTNNETLRLTNNEQSRYAISNRIGTTLKKTTDQ